jgi:serine/threonine-protein kinase
MGVVYRAEDPTLGRAVAVKVILTPAGQPLDPELEKRFLREARLAARISHPGVVTVHDAGSDKGMLYLVMELVEGDSLKQRLDAGFWPSRAQALGLVAQVADALAAAHALGVVHRDVKPANVMLTGAGRVKVSDFGIAKAVGDATEMTRTGTTLGSPAYMAPEQVKGEPLDGRADLFSLGVVLYELLLRRRPFASDTITTLVYQILNHDPLGDPETLRSLGGPTAEFLGRCLAKDPAERMADAPSFARGALELAPQQPAEVEDVVPTVSLYPPPPPPPPAAPTVAPAGPRDSPPPTLVVERAPDPYRVRLGWVLPVAAAVALAGIVLAVAGWLMFMRVVRQPSAAGPGQGTPTTVVTAGEQRLVVTPTRASAPLGEPTAPAGRSVPSAATVPPIVTPARPMAPVPTPTPTPEPTRTPTPTLEEVFICSRAADFDVEPDDAEIEVNGQRIGIADEWDDAGGGSLYEFPGPGTYYVRLSRPPRYRAAWVKIVVTPHAASEVAEVGTELQEVE